MKNNKIKTTIQDGDWWKEIADLIKCRINGFTYRNHALLYDEDNNSFTLTNSVAVNIRKLGGLK